MVNEDTTAGYLTAARRKSLPVQLTLDTDVCNANSTTIGAILCNSVITVTILIIAF